MFGSRTVVACFRPLTGTLLSKISDEQIAKLKEKNSFRPLTGTLLSKIEFVLSDECGVIEGFRPLTGTLLSKNKVIETGNQSIIVSVPSRGLSYLKMFHIIETN